MIFQDDWHILKNFRPVLMKLYYNTGLRELAKASGFQGATLTALESCSNFEYAHRFLLHVWEALYRETLDMYISNNDVNDIVDSAKCIT